jgi:CRISPR/Cas system CMR-associated protein Cmr1 (group 7 of RAMP superfamily)
MDLISLLPSPTRHSLTLSLRAITPVYLHGANSSVAAKQDASVRGALHRWLWILVEALALPNGRRPTTITMAHIEAGIFGTTAWTSGLTVRIQQIKPPPGRPASDAWPSGTEFRIEVQLRPGHHAASSPEALALAGNCWCWATVGWLGARGRKGEGVLNCEMAGGDLAEMFTAHCGETDVATVWVPPVDPLAKQQFLTRGFQGALQAVAALVPQASLPSGAAWRPPKEHCRAL